jgi:hypothetical protein
MGTQKMLKSNIIDPVSLKEHFAIDKGFPYLTYWNIQLQ